MFYFRSQTVCLQYAVALQIMHVQYPVHHFCWTEFFSLKFSESFENMYGYITDKLNTHQIHLSNF